MEECLVRHLPAAGGTSKHISRPDAHILVIPGIDDERVEEWSKAHSISLVHDLTGKDNRASNIQITVLEHQLTSSTFKQWSQLDVQAERLLVKVEDFIHTWDPEHRPLLFLCHSLGGLILKRLLVHARRREEGTKLLFDSLAGIVFLGSPHLRDSNKSEWSKVPAILELRMLSLPEDLADVSKLQRLAQWSRDFEHLNLSVPILSTREGRKSRKKKKKKKWWSIASAGDGTYIMGSDSDLACTNLTTESVKSVDTDHYGLCALNESNQFRATLIEFCHDSLRVARDRFNLPSSIIQSPALEGAAKADTFNILDGESTVASIMQTSLPNYAQATFDPSYGQSQRPRDETLIHFELKLPCYLLDDAVTVRDFFGREDVLGEIDEHLLVKEGQDIMPELRTVAISGMGGIGKTSIAYKFVKSRQNKFDAIFWLNADTAGKLASSFGEMALGLGLQKPEEDRDWVMSKNLVLQWLENPVKTYGYQTTATLPKARWLLVLDNVDDFGVMEGFWPPRGTGSILMTSRAPHVGKLTSYSDADHETSTYRIALEPFTEEEGQRFLHKLTNRKRTHDSEQAARKLARRIQGYPLFLTQFAGMMSDGLSSFNDLLKMYNEELHHHKLHGERQEIRNSKYPHTTATVWMLDKLDAAPRMVMNVLSFLDPDHIQEEILTEGAAKIKARDYPKTWNDYFAARQALWRRSLVRTAENRSKQEKDEVLANDSASEEDIGSVTGSKEEIIEQTKSQLSVHRVVQDASRSQMTREQLREAFDTAVSLLLTRWNRNERLWHYDRKDWPRAEHLYPHVVQMRYHYMQLELESQKTIASVDFVRLLDCAAWFNHERGRSQEAKELLATAFTVCKEHLDCNESLMFEIHTSLGCVATEVNDPETCYEHYKSLLRMTEEKYSDPQSEADFDALMVANNEMGIAEMMMGQTYRAKELFEIALDQASRFRDASETAKSIYLLASANLGLAQWTDGQYEEASHTLLQAWSYHEELTRAGENTSFAPGRIAHAIGNVKDSQNCEDKSDNGKEALGWYKQAYEHYEKTIGKYHHRSADVCHKLAMKYIELGDFNQARDCISQALKVFKTRDYYRPERARTKNLESILARREGKIEQADKIYEEAKKLYWKHMDEAKKGKLKSKSPKEVDFDSSVAFWSR